MIVRVTVTSTVTSTAPVTALALHHVGLVLTVTAPIGRRGLAGVLAIALV